MSLGGRPLDNRFLKPGELAFLVKPTIVSTILGSCVAIILYHPPQQLGAICHAVFPESKGELDLKFVDQAFTRMLSYFDRRQINHSDIVAKLFGGANMFCQGEKCVGAKNIVAATAAIEQAGLRLSTAEVGGAHGRKLLFNSHTGEVYLKRFRPKGDCV